MRRRLAGIEKCPTGILGLDEITGGGLPRGRPTLVCGAAGCGKSLLGVEFLMRGAVDHDEGGVLMTFEETERDISANVASLGFDVPALMKRGKLAIDHVHVDRSEIEETGEYDLQGLFFRLNAAIDSVNAKRVVLDTVESLFSGFTNQAILRSELRRLFGFLKKKGVTAIITGERGDASLTRQGLEEYVSDCVILLDHRVMEQISTRRLRIIKYRGSTHGTNEYPFLIDENGICVLPITSIGLNHSAPTDRVSSGIPRLDSMLGGNGFFRGSSILVSGTAGIGKSTLAAHFADASARRGERVLFFAFEESRDQIMRNMRSIGLRLDKHLSKDLLRFHTSRPTITGLEAHLTTIHHLVTQYKPKAVVIDPVTNLIVAGLINEVRSMLTRLVDFLKMHEITTMLTSLTHDAEVGTSNLGISSIMDSWILMRDIETGGERNRGLYVVKNRGTAHSNQIREFRITNKGIQLIDAYVGPEGVLTGSARLAQEARELAAQVGRDNEAERKRRDLDRRRALLNARIDTLRAEFDAEASEYETLRDEERERSQALAEDRTRMAVSRRADVAQTNGSNPLSGRVGGRKTARKAAK